MLLACLLRRFALTQADYEERLFFRHVVISAPLLSNDDLVVLEQADHFGTGKNNWADAVSGIDAGRAMVIVNVVAGERCSGASVEHLAARVDAR